MANVNREKNKNTIDCTYRQKSWTLHQGSFICLKNQPCKVTEVRYNANERKASTSFDFVAYSIFDRERIKETASPVDVCNVPFVHHVEYTITDIAPDGLLTLTTWENKPRVGPPLRLPPAEPGVEDDLLTRTITKLKEGKHMVVEVASSMGREEILAVKHIGQEQYPEEETNDWEDNPEEEEDLE